MILKDRLTTHWQDFDGALFDLAVVLGIVKEDQEPYPRWLFVSNNPIAVALDRILFELVDVGAIEINDDHQYRWNSDFNALNDPEVISTLLESV